MSDVLLYNLTDPFIFQQPQREFTLLYTGQQYKTFSMYTTGLFLSNTVYKSFEICVGALSSAEQNQMFLLCVYVFIQCIFRVLAVAAL